MITNNSALVDQLVETERRVDEAHSQMAELRRAGSSNRDGKLEGNSTSAPVKHRWDE